MYTPASPYTKIAYATLKHRLLERKEKPFIYPKVPDEIYRLRRGCFVSLHTAGNDLRGCIGTIEPTEKNLVEEIRHNAVAAAFHDHRFSPLTADEWNDVSLSVDVLTPPEPVSTFDELDPQIFGLIVSDGRTNRGVLLPSIPGIDSVEKQIQVTKQKANLSNMDNNQLFFFRFTSNRYH